MNEILYGAAYYDEYMPYERLEKDVEMLKKANMNVVRIAESTWSTLEPTEGTFDFTSVDRVLDAMYKGGIHVIIGTPTYAVPAWLVRKDPDVLATTKEGRGLYGPRQIMDITNKTYLFHAERVIRKLLEHVAKHPAVIGYQIDNETKYYKTAGPLVQARFVEYLKEKFNGDIEAVNKAFGLNYWSNAVHDWADFPDVRNTINASLSGEFEKFQRSLVAEFLSWQSGIICEYKTEEQFITHNFDFDWRGYSYGVQPDLDHFECAKATTVAGCDIYHPSQDHLTGREIAFCGALTYSMKHQNYLLLETQAQGFANWTPYDGQLRLLAFSHLGSGADMVEYWHWHSLHNACETYWKGVLSHDFSENHVYKEACTIGADLKRLSPELLHLKKQNDVAIMVSNESLSALRTFLRSGGFVTYNEVVMDLFTALYEQNYECDIIPAYAPFETLKQYKAILTPALYCASEETLNNLKQFTAEGGLLISTFKTGFSDENAKVYADTQPHILHEVFGAQYNQFSIAENMDVNGDGTSDTYISGNTRIDGFFECLEITSGKQLLHYHHRNWEQYAAASENTYGKGKAFYLACALPKENLKLFLKKALASAGITPGYDASFPVIHKQGTNENGRTIRYIYNYSFMPQRITIPEGRYTELISGKTYTGGEKTVLEPWAFLILRADD